MKKVGFFPVFFNLAETSRQVAVAEEWMKRGGEAIFFSHGGDYEYLAEKLGCRVVSVDPIYSDEDIDRLMKYDRLEKLTGTMLPPEWLEEHVVAEREAFQKYNIDAVSIGMDLPASISAPSLGLPLISLVPGVALPPFLKAGGGTYPDVLENSLTKFIPQSWKDWAINKFLLKTRWMTKEFNQVAKKFDVEPFKRSMELWTGDLTLVSDFKEFLGIEATEEYPKENFVGPVMDRIEADLDEDVKRHLDTDKKTIFFSMGSSGQPELFKNILEVLGKTNYHVVASFTSILDENDLPEVADNILLKKFVPGLTVNEMVDVAVLHGGQGTIYTAAYAGRPVIGIPMQYEQQWNINCLSRHGSAKQLSKKFFKGKKLLRALEQIFDNYDSYYQPAQKLSQELPEPKGAKNTAKRMEEFLQDYKK